MEATERLLRETIEALVVERDEYRNLYEKSQQDLSSTRNTLAETQTALHTTRNQNGVWEAKSQSMQTQLRDLQRKQTLSATLTGPRRRSSDNTLLQSIDSGIEIIGQSASSRSSTVQYVGKPPPKRKRKIPVSAAPSDTLKSTTEPLKRPSSHLSPSSSMSPKRIKTTHVPATDVNAHLYPSPISAQAEFAAAPSVKELSIIQPPGGGSVDTEISACSLVSSDNQLNERVLAAPVVSPSPLSKVLEIIIPGQRGINATPGPSKLKPTNLTETRVQSRQINATAGSSNVSLATTDSMGAAHLGPNDINALDPKPSPLHVSRDFITGMFRGSQQTFFQHIKAGNNPLSTGEFYFVFPNKDQNPFSPSRVGGPGLIFTNRAEISDGLPLHMMCEVPFTSDPPLYEYLGIYQSTILRRMTGPEFSSLGSTVKNAWARTIDTKTAADYPDIRMRLIEQKAKVSDATLTYADIVAEFSSSGVEGVNIVCVECIEYDYKLAEEMKAGWTEWESPPVKGERERAKEEARLGKEPKEENGGKSKSPKRESVKRQSTDDAMPVVLSSRLRARAAVVADPSVSEMAGDGEHVTGAAHGFLSEYDSPLAVIDDDPSEDYEYADPSWSESRFSIY